MVTGDQEPSAAFHGLDREVATVITGWRPANWSTDKLAVLEPLLPDVRGWVAAAAPPNVTVCRRMLSAVAAITLWGWHRFGSIDKQLLWQSRNVEWWVMVGNAERSRHWRHNTRGVLRVWVKLSAEAAGVGCEFGGSSRCINLRSALRCEKYHLAFSPAGSGGGTGIAAGVPLRFPCVGSAGR